MELKPFLQNPNLRATIELILNFPNPIEAIHNMRNSYPEFECLVQKLITTTEFDVQSQNSK